MKIDKRKPWSTSFTDDIEIGAVSKDGRNGTTVYVITSATMEERDHSEAGWHWLKFNNRQTA